ncbi:MULTISPECIES: phBC6A51 family helix-turn-helix protein [Heyndrickxia]|uniref:phBC6A51 family helix-turn-helix protein n=1 Tax=Heyndrickxia TaxID=2837504 RepID=UPI002DBEA7CB|nr:phBC6A51 family helix-turn-helix protein [Weizmannia sp. CD-2023]MEC2225015.1 phBC6A51 family helix-turn-helix protein [Weizmannia sp. CD-2023]
MSKHTKYKMRDEEKQLLIPIEELTPDEIVPLETPTSFKLTDREKRLALLLAARPMTGMTYKEIYKEAGYQSRSAGQAARQRKEVQMYVEELLDSYNREAIADVYSRLHSIIKNSKNEKTVLEAIKVWADLTGKNIQRHEVNTTVQQEKVFSVDIAKMELELSEWGLPQDVIERFAQEASAVGVEKAKKDAILTLDIDSIE